MRHGQEGLPGVAHLVLPKSGQRQLGAFALCIVCNFNDVQVTIC